MKIDIEKGIEVRIYLDFRIAVTATMNLKKRPNIMFDLGSK
jgi:hypothetical protein